MLVKEEKKNVKCVCVRFEFRTELNEWTICLRPGSVFVRIDYLMVDTEAEDLKNHGV